MKKLIIFLTLIILTNFVNAQSYTKKFNVQHGDTIFLKTTVTSYTIDSVERYIYSYHNVLDSTVTQDTVIYFYAPVADTTPYMYHFRVITGVTADSIQINNIPHKTINNTSPLGVGNIAVAGGSGVSQQALDDTATAIRTTVNGKSESGHNHTGVYQPVGSYLVAADIAGKLDVNGNGSSLTGLTKTQVGLSNADNTSDANKPVSAAQQAALDAKQNTISLTTTGTSGAATFIGNTLNVPNYATGGGGAPTFINLTSLFSSTSTTPSTVTGWSFAVTSGKTYRITVIADYQTAATTTGGILGISLTTATGTVRGYASGTVVNTAAATELKIPIRTTSGAGSTLTTTGVTATNSPHYIGMDITFTCTGSGTFNIVWGTEVNASAAQLNANSTLLYQALN